MGGGGIARRDGAFSPGALDNIRLAAAIDDMSTGRAGGSGNPADVRMAGCCVPLPDVPVVENARVPLHVSNEPGQHSIPVVQNACRMQFPPRALRTVAQLRRADQIVVVVPAAAGNGHDVIDGRDQMPISDPSVLRDRNLMDKERRSFSPRFTGVRPGHLADAISPKREEKASRGPFLPSVLGKETQEGAPVTRGRCRCARAP